MKNLKLQVGIADLLFLTFLTLKLTGYVGWSWWWVFSPITIPLMILGVVYLQQTERINEAMRLIKLVEDDLDKEDKE